MKRVDGDAALLVFFVLVGLIPVMGDATAHRNFGAESTLGMLMAASSLVALYRRGRLLFRARSLRRNLLTQER